MERIIPREIESDIMKWIDRKEVIAIRGPRQCGKTTFLNTLAGKLKKKGIKNIHYITFEDDFEKQKFENNPKDYISFHQKEGQKNYFLFDEVQYIRDAGKIFKLIYDIFEDIKIIMTGSSTLDLNDIGSYLVGRVILFEMQTFSFGEFLLARDDRLFRYYEKKKISFRAAKISEEKLTYLEDLNVLLREYITFGGYPAIVLERDIEKKKVLLKNLVQTYIEKDIVKLYGSRYRQRILDLVYHLSSINGSMINYNEISSQISLYHKEVKQILSILEETYIIRMIRPFHKNLATELKKNPKIYFFDTGLRNLLSGRFDFSPEEYGKLLENYLLNSIRSEKVNYWRTTAKAEVDFILDKKIPIEAKIKPKISRSFRSFIDTYRPKNAFIVNMDSFETKKIKNTQIILVPFALV